MNCVPHVALGDAVAEAQRYDIKELGQENTVLMLAYVSNTSTLTLGLLLPA